jgi:hypothetical protein
MSPAQSPPQDHAMLLQAGKFCLATQQPIAANKKTLFKGLQIISTIPVVVDGLMSKLEVSEFS